MKLHKRDFSACKRAKTSFCWYATLPIFAWDSVLRILGNHECWDDKMTWAQSDLRLVCRTWRLDIQKHLPLSFTFSKKGTIVAAKVISILQVFHNIQNLTFVLRETRDGSTNVLESESYDIFDVVTFVSQVYHPEVCTIHLVWEDVKMKTAFILPRPSFRSSFAKFKATKFTIRGCKELRGLSHVPALSNTTDLELTRIKGKTKLRVCGLLQGLKVLTLHPMHQYHINLLQRCPTLACLKLSFQAPLWKIKRQNNLLELTIEATGTRLSPEQAFTTLSNFVTNCPNLQRLRLEKFSRLGRVETCLSVSVMDFATCFAQDDEIRLFLASFPNLKELGFSFTNIFTRTTLEYAFASCRLIETFCAYDCYLPNESRWACKKLRSVRLSRIKGGSEVSSDWSSLEELEITFVDSMHVSTIENIVAKASKLRKLHLSGIFVCDTELRLSSGSIEDVAICSDNLLSQENVSFLLEHCTGLRSLRLSSPPRVSLDFTTAIAPNLQKVSLLGCEIVPPGFGDGFAALKQVDLEFCDVLDGNIIIRNLLAQEILVKNENNLLP